MLLTWCMWKQLCTAHESTCDVLVHHFYSSAAVLFADAVSSAGCLHQRQLSATPQSRAPARNTAIPPSSAASVRSGSATRAVPRPVSAPRASSATRVSSVTPAQRRGVSPTVVTSRPTCFFFAWCEPNGRHSRPTTVARPLNAPRKEPVTSSPRASLRSSVNSAQQSKEDREVVTIPGYRTVSPIRRGQLVPAPAPSVKALFEERRRCDVRREALKDDDPNADPLGDTITTGEGDTSQPSQNGRRVEQRRLSVLHSVPIDHQRTIASQRSPVARRTSPVRSASANRPTPAASQSSAIATNGGVSLKTALDNSVLLRKSPVRRLVPPSPVVARNTKPAVQPQSLEPVSRTVSSARSTSAGGRECRLSSLLDPRASGGVSSRGASPRSMDEVVSTQTSVASISIRRPSPQAQSQRSSTGLFLPPVASASRRSTPRQAITSARSSSNGLDIPSIDYVVEVFQCSVNRTLEVDMVPTESSTPLRVNDLLLEVDGKSMSTVDQLRAYLELMYRGAAGRRMSISALPAATSVSLLRGTEFLVIDVPLPRTCGGGIAARSVSPSGASVATLNDELGSTSEPIFVN
ncbi:Hypothetical protein, putative [Bodo saltans]|uniref:PDZ domain-containing protein n=1 Tax=Bodo saltans TaxID=75058 RepID=A0A0S4JMY4_BODSA|nr:Hypothetical protein, putative [Bodo saltans]|eukprot:CUG91588.1 Hypothetical protein, putative [Bodo saltans]